MSIVVLICGWILFAAIAFGAAGFVVTSARERRLRPVLVSAALFTPLLAGLATLLLVEFTGQMWILAALLLMVAGIVVILTYPTGPGESLRIPGPPERTDERDAIFHRHRRLEAGTPEFEAYYAEHPEHRAVDERIRALPHLGHPGGRTYDPFTAPLMNATFDVLETLTHDIDHPPDPVEGTPVQASPAEFTTRIKGFARYLGADLVGTTKLNPAYVYSHIGRSPGPWGEPIELNHANAIAIAVEMDHEMIRHAPDNAVTTETAFKYFEAAKIALILARYIRMLGYEARGHVDGNYRVLCGPIAADAGLGELGRLGLLMSPTCGPRMRLAIVTTDLPLAQDKPISIGAQHFCTLCRKCATCCPSASIDNGEKRVVRGVEKWQSNQETCYNYWRVQGSDCAVCIRVCPYAHPGTFPHNIVRWAIRRNALARRAALLGDDLFFGRKPLAPYKLPPWHARQS